MDLPPVDINEIDIIRFISDTDYPHACKNKNGIEHQMRLYGFPLGEALDSLVSKGYLNYADENAVQIDNGEFYILSKNGREWVENNLIV